MTYNELTLEEIEKSVRRAEKKDRRKRLRRLKHKKTIPNKVNVLSTQTGDNNMSVKEAKSISS